MISVYVVDDHEVVVEGIRHILESASDLEWAGSSSSGRGALEQIRAIRPSVALFDLTLPDCSGFDLIEPVRTEAPGTHVVVFSVHDEEEYIARALTQGAMGYVSKAGPPSELLRAIRAAASGERYVCAMLAPRALAGLATAAKSAGADPTACLTSREREILFRMASGLNTSQIAGELFLSPRTVEGHRHRAIQRLGLRNHGELMRFAIQHCEALEESVSH